jgi:hypothetical protein
MLTVTLYPRWQQKKDNSMEVGFEIPENSTDWKVFVQQRLSDSKQEKI